MLQKLGVDISRLERNTRKGLNVVNRVLEKEGIEGVVTSTYEGNHSAGSLHYANQAVDVRSKGLTGDIVEDIKTALGDEYDVVLEANHLHIEYDPK